jgi:outer membrane protein assembly factor BamB
VVYALNPNASLQWTFPTGLFGISASPAVDANGIIYVGAQDNKFYAINPDGTSKWTHFTTNFISSNAAIGFNNFIYFGDFDHTLHAVKGDGSGSTSAPSVTRRGLARGSQ